MFQNHLNTILRHLRKRKLFALINISGLSIGLASSMLILLYVFQELSYDEFHENADRIYRVTRAYDYPNGYNHHFARVPDTWINYLPDEFPEVDKLVRLQQFRTPNIKIGENRFRASNAFATDAHIFEVFSFPLLKGEPETALAQPNSVVISRRIAEKYFPEGAPLGKTIEFLDDSPVGNQRYEVTGVMDDLPENAHFDLHFLTSIKSPEDRSGWAYVYLLLEEGTDPEALAAKLPAFVDEYHEEENASSHNALKLQAITDIHLHSHLARELEANGNISTVYVFALIALFILLLGGINFVNLSIAQTAERSREMGMRKLLGSSHRQLITYLLGESCLLALAGMGIALVLIYYFQPVFTSITGVRPDIWNISVLGIFLLSTLIFGLLAGAYPALRIAAVAPLSVLRHQPGISIGAGRWSLRKALVVLQFAISIGLIICTVVTYQQFHFLRNKNLGLNKDQVLVIPDIPLAAKQNYYTFKQEVENLPGVLGVSAAMEEPSDNIRDTGNVFAEGKVEEADKLAMDILTVDQNFLELMDIKFVAGGAFPPGEIDPSRIAFEQGATEIIDQINSRERSYILNEAAVVAAGWNTPEEAIGKTFSWSNTTLDFQRGPVAGVVENFNFSSLHNAVRPIVMVWEPYFFGGILIKVNPGQMDRTLAGIRDRWQRLMPDYAFEYLFLDDLFARLYTSEKQQARILGLFALIAVFIAALGMLGLAAIAARQRRREISIRKVVGASVFELLRLLAKEFVVLVVVANILAYPFAYLLMRRWLEGFAYRTSLQAHVFLLAGLATLLIALLAVSWHTLRAARTNPAKVLSTE